jgi:hypothetical protein
VEALGLKNVWDVIFFYVDEIDGQKVFAEVEKDPPYLKAKIKFSRWAVDHALDRDLETVIIHELLHVVFEPIEIVSRTYCDGSGEVGTELAAAMEITADHLTMVLRRLKYPVEDAAYHDSELTAFRSKKEGIV